MRFPAVAPAGWKADARVPIDDGPDPQRAAARWQALLSPALYTVPDPSSNSLFTQTPTFRAGSYTGAALPAIGEALGIPARAWQPGCQRRERCKSMSMRDC